MPKPVHVNESNEFRLLYHPYQQAFLKARRLRLADGSRAFHRFCFIAGRRSGKTLGGAIAAVEEATVPKTLGWCIAPTYGDLHDYVLPAVMQVLPQAWLAPGKDGWSAFHQRLTLKNGSQIAFRSAEDPERMRGPGLHWLWIDEARKTSPVVWDTVRPALTEHRGAAILTTTPNGYDWVYREFWQRAAHPGRQRPGYWAGRCKTIDNPAIPTEEIEEARATTDALWFRQEYEAEFVVFEGSIYGERLDACVLHTDEAVRARFLPEWPTIPAGVPVLIGLDPGADHPFAAVKIIATPAGLLVVGEYRRRMTAYADHAEGLRTLARSHDDVSWAIDRTATQAQIELAVHGISSSAADNNVTLGIQRVQSWLKTQRIGFVASRCPLLLEELHGYRWKDTQTSRGEKGREQPFKQDDDLCDALRYAVMLWPELPQVPAPVVGRDRRQIPEDLRWAWEREQRCSRPRAEGEIDWSIDLDPHADDWSPTGDLWIS